MNAGYIACHLVPAVFNEIHEPLKFELCNNTLQGK